MSNPNKEQMYRIEIRFDFLGTEVEAKKEAAKVAHQISASAEVTAIFDENFEEI